MGFFNCDVFALFLQLTTIRNILFLISNKKKLKLIKKIYACLNTDKQKNTAEITVT